MNIRRISILALCVLAPVSGFAAKLLSDNPAKSGVASYPASSELVNTGSIYTGASYEFLVNDSVGTGYGTTDPDLLKFDITRLFDGYNERVGNTAVYGAWHGNYGATVLIDLKGIYNIEAVSASLRTSGRRGATTFLAQVSEDGQAFQALGVWDQERTVLDSEEDDAGRNVEIVISASAPVAARYIKVFLSHWNEAHTDRMLNQLVIGELAVWGDEVSE
jgi:hypothetical protein